MMINWIESSERLPETVSICLGWCEGDYEFVKYDGDKWQVFMEHEGGWIDAYDVTHWIYLNQPEYI